MRHLQLRDLLVHAELRLVARVHARRQSGGEGGRKRKQLLRVAEMADLEEQVRSAQRIVFLPAVVVAVQSRWEGGRNDYTAGNW